jgi:hypothetical protein
MCLRTTPKAAAEKLRALATVLERHDSNLGIEPDAAFAEAEEALGAALDEILGIADLEPRPALHNATVLVPTFRGLAADSYWHSVVDRE